MNEATNPPPRTGVDEDDYSLLETDLTIKGSIISGIVQLWHRGTDRR